VVGVFMGLTPDLTTAGKYIIIALMFIGRIGILSFLWFMSSPNKKDHYHLPEEKVIIG
jgi:Trk-type K+ transport system membrane component